MNIKIKRVYEQPDKGDGVRILVDRLWPRGLTKEKARVDLWLKEIAPSTELRKWFDHDPEKWKSFRGRYETEIRHKDDLIEDLYAALPGQRHHLRSVSARAERSRRDSKAAAFLHRRRQLRPHRG